MEEGQYQVRRRVNVKTSTAGVITFDCTVEIVSPLQNDPLDGSRNDPILSESDDLVAKLQERYPLNLKA